MPLSSREPRGKLPSMADTYLIDIDAEQVRRNFTQGDGREWSPAEVRAWLIEHDFVATPEGWIAEEVSLGLLAKGEYRIIKQTT